MEDGDARVGLTEAAHAGGAAVGRAGAGPDEPTDQRGDLGGEAPLSQTSTRQPDTHRVPVPIHAPHGAGQQVTVANEQAVSWEANDPAVALAIPDEPGVAIPNHLAVAIPRKEDRSNLFYMSTVKDGANGSVTTCPLACCTLTHSYSNLSNPRNRLYDEETQQELNGVALAMAQLKQQRAAYRAQLKDLKAPKREVEMKTWAGVQLVGHNRYTVKVMSVGEQLLVRADHGWYQDLSQGALDALRISGIPPPALPTHHKGIYDKHDINWMHLSESDNRRLMQKTLLCLTAGQMVSTGADPKTGEPYPPLAVSVDGAATDAPALATVDALITAFEALPFYSFKGGHRRTFYPLKGKFYDLHKELQKFYEEACNPRLQHVSILMQKKEEEYDKQSDAIALGEARKVSTLNDERKRLLEVSLVDLRVASVGLTQIEEYTSVKSLSSESAKLWKRTAIYHAELDMKTGEGVAARVAKKMAGSSQGELEDAKTIDHLTAALNDSQVEMDGVKRALNESEEASAHSNMALWRVLKRQKMHTEELLADATITSVRAMLVDIGDGSTVPNLPSNKKKRAEKAMKFIVDRIGENPM